MLRSKRKYLVAIIATLVLSTGVAFSSFTDQKINPLQTSVLPVLEEVLNNNTVKAPDLVIEKASFKKVSEPTEDFNYFRYEANVVLRNQGGDLRNAKVVLSAGDGQRHIYIKNSPEGFSLGAGQSYIINDYDVIFDGDYNAGKINLNIGIKDKIEKDKGNNFFAVDVVELPAKISNIGIKRILDDGSVELDFVIPKQNLADEVYILRADFLEEQADEKDENIREEYDEFWQDGKPFGFQRLQIGEDVLAMGDLKIEEISLDQTLIVPGAGYYFLKAENPETGNYVVTNVLKINEREPLTRARFAKLFVEHAKLEIFDEGAVVYEDVSPKAWYAPYVQTLYNLGLIKTGEYNFAPEKIINRGEVLRVVLDYFDVDLEIKDGGAHFTDVKEDDPIYSYAEALFASGKAQIFDDYLAPGGPADENFLKYLINEYS